MTPLALTMGEAGGIGPEISVMAWRELAASGPAFALLADPALIRARAVASGLGAVPIREVELEAAGTCFKDALPVVPLAARAPDRPGVADPSGAAAVIEAIDRSVAAVVAGTARAIVTNPIQKSALYAAGFAHPGHTEYLGELALRLAGAPATPIMMLASDELRVVPVTVHVALAEVPRLLTVEKIVDTGRIVARELSTRFSIAEPRLAVAGLNPHAGEDGTMGKEDETIVRPAVEALRGEGIAVAGPLPADTMFHPAARTRYDAALCMYHDQALIPLKTLAFDEGVNVTLGLPFVRTSPDHGTALDIAGTGRARATSLIAALKLADRLSFDKLTMRAG